jgi:N-acetylglucosaminyldiphosphoundecaprenol N-acetyl-beta-D-mannosaminyltransferase
MEQKTTEIHQSGNLDFAMTANAEPIKISDIEPSYIGGVNVARLSLDDTARAMIGWARAPKRDAGPLFLTSVNSEVLTRCSLDTDFGRLLESADVISVDGQPLVFASRLLSRNSLPERVATTDLYPAVARLAEDASVSFYLYGGRDDINLAAFEATRARYPRLDIRGRSHGYLKGDELERKIDEINALAPDILWLSLGVPLEQEFVRRYSSRLSNVKMIKTSGGLVDFVSGTKKRAPLWVQKAGFEWAFRICLEPRRLLWRYLQSNTVALYLLITQTR